MSSISPLVDNSNGKLSVELYSMSLILIDPAYLKSFPEGPWFLLSLFYWCLSIGPNV